ncbi:MAG: hypothetical protein ABIE94_05140 [archaeon]
MVDETIKTGVDELIELLKNTEKIALRDAAKKLNVPMNIMQSWVDFLVEEKIVGVEYKFTKPFIYLNTEKRNIKPEVMDEERVSLDLFKEDFRLKAIRKNIPEQMIETLWVNHLVNEVERLRAFFFKETRKRELSNIEVLWSRYKKNIMST